MGKRIDRLDRKAKYIARLYRALVDAGWSDIALCDRNDWDDHIAAGNGRGGRIVRCEPDTADVYGPWGYRDRDGFRLAGVIERDDDPGPAVSAVEKYLSASPDDEPT